MIWKRLSGEKLMSCPPARSSPRSASTFLPMLGLYDAGKSICAEVFANQKHAGRGTGQAERLRRDHGKGRAGTDATAGCRNSVQGIHGQRRRQARVDSSDAALLEPCVQASGEAAIQSGE